MLTAWVCRGNTKEKVNWKRHFDRRTSTNEETVVSTRTGWITGLNGDCNSLPAGGKSIVLSLNLSVTSLNNPYEARNGNSQKVTISFVNTFIEYIKVLSYAEVLDGLIFDSLIRFLLMM